MPAAASLFCIDFLSLRLRHWRLYRLHVAVVAAAALLSPVDPKSSALDENGYHYY